MALVLLLLVLLALALAALLLHTRGRIVIIWGELWPGGEDALGPALRAGRAPPRAAPPSWEGELQRQLRRQLAASPLPRHANRTPPLHALPVADGEYRLLPPLSAAQEGADGRRDA